MIHKKIQKIQKKKKLKKRYYLQQQLESPFWHGKY